MVIKASLAIAALSVVVTGAPAAAATYIFEETDLGGNHRVGTHDAVKTTYDTDTDLFTWSFTFGRNPRNNKLADGGWLVVNGGGNPKGEDKEHVIFYLDGKQNKVSLYEYDGKNGSNSWKTNDFLGATTLGVTNSGNQRTFDFSFDMTDVNALKGISNKWKGTSFEEHVGIWFHGVDSLSTEYYSDETIRSFKYRASGWYDTDKMETEKVPEPGTVLAMGLVAGTAAFTKSRRRSA